MNKEYLRLLEYVRSYQKKSHRLILDDKNLIDLANMHPNSVRSFFDILSYYFSTSKVANGDFTIFKTKTEIFDSNGKLKQYQNNYLETNLKNYEKLKEEIFKCAYMYCNYDAYDTDGYYGSLHAVMQKRLDNHYACIYKADNHYIIKNGPEINKEDYQKRLTYIKR